MIAASHISAARPAPRRAFTLIEILVVIAIIIILVAAVLAVGSNIRANALIRTTQTTLQALEAAAGAFREQPGNPEVPPTDPAKAAQMDVTDMYYVTFKAVPECKKPLEKIAPQYLTATGVNDAWGNAIHYFTPGANGAPPIKGYFVSAGPDQTFGTPDDILSTEAMK